MSQLLDEIHNGLEDLMYTKFLNVQCLPLPSLLLAMHRTSVEVVILDLEGKIFIVFYATKYLWFESENNFSSCLYNIYNTFKLVI